MNRKNFLKFSIYFAFFALLLGGVWGQTTCTWTGANGTDWDDVGNWDNGLPALDNEPSIPVVASNWPSTVNTSMPTGWTSLTIDNGAQATIPVEISINSITNNGDLTLDANITLSGSLTGTGTVSAGATTLTVSGDFAVNSFSAGTSTVNLGGTGTVSAHSFATLNITGGTRTLTGDVTAQTFSSATGTNIAGAHNLIINGNAVFGGTAGSGTALASLSVSGTSAINTTAITTAGTQTYTGAVTLGGDVVLTADSGSASSDIEFGSDLNGGSKSLTVDGNLAFTNASPSVTNLSTLVFTGNNAQTFSPGGAEFVSVSFESSGVVTVSNILNTSGTVTINGGAVNLTAGGSLGSVDIQSGSLSLGSDITVKGNWSNTAGALTHNNRTVTFDPPASGTITISGGTSFYDLSCINEGGQTLTINGAITVSNNLILSGSGLGNNLTINGSGSIDLVNSQINGSYLSVGPDIEITTGIYTTINSSALSTVPSGWNILSGELIYVWSGDTDTDWDDAGNWEVGIVPPDGADVLIPEVTSSMYPILSSAINLSSFIIASNASLTLNEEYITCTTGFTNNGIVYSLGSEVLDLSGSVTAGVWEYTDGTVHTGLTFSEVRINGAVTSPSSDFSTAVLSVSSGTFTLAGNVEVTGTLTNNASIVIEDNELRFLNYAENTTSTVNIENGTITSTKMSGPAQDVSRITFTNGSTATINGGGGITLGVDDYNTVALVTTGIVNLPTGTIASLNVQSGTASVGDIEISGDLSVTGTLNASSSTITFSGADDQTINPGTHIINAINIAKTDGSISFTTNPLTVTSLIQSNSDSFAIIFNENLSVTDAVSFATPGTVTLGTAVTDTFAFYGGITHTTGATNLAGILQTSSNPISLANLTLIGNSTINAGTGIVSISGTTSGLYDLDITGVTVTLATVNGLNNLDISDGAVFNGTVEVGSLAVSGTSTINTTTITTSENQTYDGDVILGANTTLTTTNANIHFVSAVDSFDSNAHDLTLIAGSGNIIFGNTVGATNPLGTLTITSGATVQFAESVTATGAILVTSAKDVSFTGNVKAASFTQNEGTDTTFNGIQNYTGNFAFTGENLIVNKSLTVGGTTIIANSGQFTTSNAGIIVATGGFSQTGTGTNSIGANITTDNNISFASSIDLTQGIVFSTGTGAGDISFLEAINSQGGERLLDLNAGSGSISFGSTVGSAAQPLSRLVLRESSQVSFNGAVRASDGVFVLAGAVNATWTSASSINFPNTDIYFDHNGKTITLNSNLSARNIYFYRGNLNLANRIVNTTADFVVFGNYYDPNDPEWTGADTRFAYFETPSLKYYPAGGTYTDGVFSTPPNASFSDLSGSKISVGANFYNNGANMNVGAFTLNLASGTGSAPQFNATNAVFAGQWGTPYAVAFNMSVENSTANNWVTASTVAQGVSGQDITDGGTNTRWQFKRPEISAAATVFDNVIRITSSMPLRNANNEINSMVLQAAGSVVDGSIWYNSGALKFTGVFSDEGCNTPLSTEDPVTEFYIKTENGTWNTDATGASPVDDDSTDRSGAHQTTIPNLTLLPGLFRAAEGVTMIQAYGTHGQALFDGTTDEARPVLIAVEIGQEAHESDPTLQAPYDAHNYIQLRYSEPVDIEGFDSAGEMKEYIKINDEKGPLPKTGKIINVDSGLEITDLISIDSGSLSTGSRDVDNIDINTVHALYRNFSLDPFNGSEPVEAQPHHLRISIAGWTDIGDLIDINGQYYYFYPGFIVLATEPSGTISVKENSKIKDASGNTLDHTNALPISVQVLAGSGWDTTPPSIAKYVEDEDGWPGKPTNESYYEIIGIDTGGGRVGHFELHIFDNEPEYTSSDTQKWFFGKGWQDDSDFPDTRGGFGNKSGLGGIRMSSLVNSLQAFSYEERGSHFGPGMKGFKFDNASIKQNYASTFLGGPSVLTISDVPYLRLYLEDDDTTLFPMITNFSLQYKMYDQDSSPNGGFITDLAGNLLQDFEGLSIDRTPPSISMTLAPIGSNLLYVLFSKRLNIDDLTEIRDGLSVTGSGDAIAIDSYASVRVKSHIPVGTALIFQLGREVTFDDLLLGRITIDAGENIRDFSEVNHADDNHNHVLSDFALGGIDVLYGYDNKFQILGEGVLAEGDWTLRDFTGTKLTTNKMLTDTDITIATRLSPNGDVDEEAITMILDVDPVSDSLSTIYNFNTDSDWTIWLPTLLPALSKTANAKAKEVAQETGEDAERNFIIPNDSGNPDSFNWKDGDEVEFFFRYDDGETGSFTFDHDGNAETPEVPLYFFRLKDPKDPTSVDLWRFSLSDISRQRGGITVLNNVINSLKKEETIVELDIKKAGNVTVHVLTLDGNIVKTLQRGRLNPGLHYFKWNGTNLSGAPVARGIYFMRVVGPDIDETRKVMVIKE